MESVVISCIDLLNSTDFPELILLGTTAAHLAKQSKDASQAWDIVAPSAKTGAAASF